VTNSNEDWLYGEYGKPTDPVDIDRILQGAGWDQPDSPYDRSSEKLLPQTPSGCDCDLVALEKAINELHSFLLNSPNKFPRTHAQLHSFTSFGGYASGSWTTWVDIERSLIDASSNSQVIFLSKRCSQNHFCKLIRSPDHSLNIEWPDKGWVELIPSAKRSQSLKSTRELLDEIAVPIDETLPPEEIDKILFESEAELFGEDDDQEDQEELSEERYDERTFGDLDLAQPAAFQDKWFESGFSDEESLLFRLNNLMVDDVFELMKHMPHGEVRNWVSKFKQNSLVALDLLKLTKSNADTDHTHDPEIQSQYIEALSESIRNAIELQLRNWLRHRPPSKKR